ncbi:hypothetical protein C3L33_21482, partial [Rhododendron williamsianum]
GSTITTTMATTFRKTAGQLTMRKRLNTTSTTSTSLVVHLAELGAIAAGAFAVHEKHMIKKDPAHAHRHKVEERIATTVAVAAGGYALHEHHEKKEAKKQMKHHHGHHFF